VRNSIFSFGECLPEIVSYAVPCHSLHRTGGSKFAADAGDPDVLLLEFDGHATAAGSVQFGWGTVALKR
jgi:hypothetical protein